MLMVGTTDWESREAVSRRIKNVYAAHSFMRAPPRLCTVLLHLYSVRSQRSRAREREKEMVRGKQEHEIIIIITSIIPFYLCLPLLYRPVSHHYYYYFSGCTVHVIYSMSIAWLLSFIFLNFFFVFSFRIPCPTSPIFFSLSSIPGVAYAYLMQSVGVFFIRCCHLDACECSRAKTMVNWWWRWQRRTLKNGVQLSYWI